MEGQLQKLADSGIDVDVLTKGERPTAHHVYRGQAILRMRELIQAEDIKLAQRDEAYRESMKAYKKDLESYEGLTGWRKAVATEPTPPRRRGAPKPTSFKRNGMLPEEYAIFHHELLKGAPISEKRKVVDI